ncbi:MULTISPECIES: response regulator transcription factor [unclassified Rhizobium]|uniref:response regulator transcription factor n=1 Tax=unclassified Rhizobium TaxID=2613769 RepID=UPI000DB9179B|nr:helix-turn-helix transcriptional regulator [Rhizobium sp. 16-449-1b]MBO9197044.1 helix-turn-helix transcriptional regulator [Rhizobium sp. 16-449-1b]
MTKDTTFHTVTQKLLDAWLSTSPHQPGPPEAVYRDAVDLLTIKMRLTVVVLDGEDPLDWRLQVVRSSGFASRILNINKLFANQRIGDFKDRSYMETAVIPRYREVIASQKPSMEMVKTELLGVNIAYERMVLPQRTTEAKPAWLLTVTNGRFMFNAPERQAKLDGTDEAVVQLLTEGATAKQIATELGISHRTVEHRLERMKERYGAKNTVHLTAMLVAMHLHRETDRN